MCRLDSRLLEQYFYHGIDNVPEVLEGIVFFSTREMHKLYKNLDDQYDQSNDVQLKQIKDFAYRYGLQYYRFISLNESPNILADYKTKDEMNKVKSAIDKTIDNLISRNCLKEYGIGYYFPRELEGKYLETCVQNNRVRKNWTIEISEQLKVLSMMEKENPIEYYKSWIDVKLKRAELREQKCEKEISAIKFVQKQLDEKIAKEKAKQEEYEELTK